MSVINKTPFIATLISSLTNEQKSSLTSLINGVNGTLTWVQDA